MTGQQGRTIVVGAGIVGAATAWELQRRGHAVTLIDRDAPGQGASYGNMAIIAVSEFLPASRPAVWRQMPGWLVDPQGPVSIRPSYVPRLIPWFWRFLLASRPARVRAIEAAGAALCQRALGDTLDMLEALDARDMISDTGSVMLYADAGERRADADHLAMLERFGIAHDILDRAALQALEPALSPDFESGLLVGDDRAIRDPHRLVTLLVERFGALGGTLCRGTVAAVERSERATGVRLADGTVIASDTVVLAAGVHTAPLARALGEAIPLETERGYHTQIMAPGLSLRHPLFWPARAFVVTPTAGGIRVGGTVEMAGLDAPPDWRRARATARHARRMLPGLQVDETSEWMGHRPALPDTIPVISESKTTPGVFYATGHGHLGLTNAATTARLMAQLVDGNGPDIDLAPYRIDRF